MIIEGKRCALVLAVGAGVAALSICCMDLWAGSRFAPVHCSSCQLSTPLVDPSTKAFLNTYRLNLGMGGVTASPMKVQTGDVVTVCNGASCVSYEASYDGGWEGGEPKRQTSNPPSGAGGGGGKSHPPSAGVVGGGGGGRTGTVTVGGGGGSSGGRTGTVTVGTGRFQKNDK